MDALLFDFDGVIVDSEPIHLRSFRDVLAGQGIDLATEAYFSRYLGFDDHDCFAAVFADNGRSIDEAGIAELTTAKTRLVQMILRRGVEALPGSVDLVVTAAEASQPMAICSGALRAEIELALSVIGLADCFPVLVAAEDVERGKPDPEGYQRARALLADAVGRPLQPERCVVCEDSPAGIAAARAAGMKVCALTTSYPSEQVAEADLIVPDLSCVTLAELAALV